MASVHFKDANITIYYNYTTTLQFEIAFESTLLDTFVFHRFFSSKRVELPLSTCIITFCKAILLQQKGLVLKKGTTGVKSMGVGDCLLSSGRMTIIMKEHGREAICMELGEELKKIILAGIGAVAVTAEKAGSWWTSW
jgi:hypothetical protein